MDLIHFILCNIILNNSDPRGLRTVFLKRIEHAFWFSV